MTWRIIPAHAGFTREREYIRKDVGIIPAHAGFTVYFRSGGW